jgi:hypothetical protein
MKQTGKEFRVSPRLALGIIGAKNSERLLGKQQDENWSPIVTHDGLILPSNLLKTAFSETLSQSAFTLRKVIRRP